MLLRNLFPLFLLFCTNISDAQKGDKAGHQMVDPIPSEQIPPSPYLDLNQALASIELAPRFIIEPVASGKLVNKVVALAFDSDGRVFGPAKWLAT